CGARRAEVHAMVSEQTLVGLEIAQITCAILAVLIVLRIVYILNANPIGEFAQELVYLRIRELRAAGYAVLVVLLLEIGQLIVPFLTRQGVLREEPDLAPILNTAEGALILVAAMLVL